MEKLAYEFLVEVGGKMEAELIKSYLEAEGVPVEIFQESIMASSYPTTFAPAQIFVPKTQIKEARQLLKQFQNEGDKKE